MRSRLPRVPLALDGSQLFCSSQALSSQGQLRTRILVGKPWGATSGFMPDIHPAFSTAELQRYQQIGELAYMQEKARISREYVIRQPLTFVQNSLLRFQSFWFPILTPIWLAVPLLSATAMIGCFFLVRIRPPGFEIVVIPLLVYPLPYYLTHSDLRYQHPIHPLLAILAAYAITVISTSKPVST